MTIKTLEYIHALLIEDERKRKEIYEEATKSCQISQRPYRPQRELKIFTNSV